MATCYSFILEPVREGNYTGTFVRVVFKFLSLCTNLGSEIAEKTGLPKLFSRSIKRGNEEIKALTAKINENIAATDKRTKAARGLDKTSKAAATAPKLKQEAESVAGVKRPRPVETGSAQPAKRVASSAITPGSKESTAAKLGLVKKAGAPTAAPAVMAAKTKVVKAPTTTGGFLGLQSASKKPGTSNVVKKAAPSAAAEKKPVIAPVVAARPAFSFAETMANLEKVKEEEKKPVKKTTEPERPPETEAEKAKRLRKEERRALRVRWNNTELVQVRTFSPDPSELSGRARNVKDVSNGQEKEGATLKKHMDMMDLDDGDDDAQPLEQTYFDYRDPSLIDFTTVPEDERARNYERFGGDQKVESTERAVQDNYEANTLMVHYLAKDDIPPTPREPVDPYNGIQVEMKEFGYPDETSSWLIERLRQNPPPPPPLANPVANIDIQALLQSIGAGQLQQPQQAPHPPPMQQPAYSWPFQQQALEPAAPAPDSNNALASILAQLTAGNQQQPAAPAAPAPPMFQPPPIPTAATPAPAPNMDVQSLMASLMATAQANGTAPPPIPPPDITAANPYAGYTPYLNPALGSDGAQQPDFSAYYAAMANQYAPNASGDRDQGKRKQWSGNESKKYTHPCRFYKEGKCKKGDSCTFRHDD